MDRDSDADDIYGDDAESQASYEYIDEDDDDDDDPVMVDAGGPDSLDCPPELRTWQSALHESLGAVPSSSGAPGAESRMAARQYRARVVALEREAATRAAMLVLRGESEASSRMSTAARPCAACCRFGQVSTCCCWRAVRPGGTTGSALVGLACAGHMSPIGFLVAFRPPRCAL